MQQGFFSSWGPFEYGLVAAMLSIVYILMYVCVWRTHMELGRVKPILVVTITHGAFPLLFMVLPWQRLSSIAIPFILVLALMSFEIVATTLTFRIVRIPAVIMVAVYTIWTLTTGAIIMCGTQITRLPMLEATTLTSYLTVLMITGFLLGMGMWAIPLIYLSLILTWPRNVEEHTDFKVIMLPVFLAFAGTMATWISIGNRADYGTGAVTSVATILCTGIALVNKPDSDWAKVVWSFAWILLSLGVATTGTLMYLAVW